MVKLHSAVMEVGRAGSSSLANTISLSIFQALDSMFVAIGFKSNAELQEYHLFVSPSGQYQIS